MSVERLGRYEIVEPLGRGGMARVDLARVLGDAGFVRLVALKRLHARLAATPSMVARFHDEAALAARVRHANVVSVVDVLVEDGNLAIAFDLVVGVSLRDVLKSAGAEGIPAPFASRIASDMLEGLHAAHTTHDEHGSVLAIVHRDVSPANVLIDEGGVAKVTDFGLAKARKRLAETAPGDLHGTVAYMAPERLRGGDVDARCDVYATSVILWEMLSGRKLFGGQDGELVWRILEGAVTPAGVGRSDVAPELASIVARGLARDPTDRFGSAREMALALERASPPAPARALATWLEYRLKNELTTRRARAHAALRGEPVDSGDIAPETNTGDVTRTLTQQPATLVDANSRLASFTERPSDLPASDETPRPLVGEDGARTLVSEPLSGMFSSDDRARTLRSEPPPGMFSVDDRTRTLRDADHALVGATPVLGPVNAALPARRFEAAPVPVAPAGVTRLRPGVLALSAAAVLAVVLLLIIVLSRSRSKNEAPMTETSASPSSGVTSASPASEIGAQPLVSASPSADVAAADAVSAKPSAAPRPPRRGRPKPNPSH